MERSDIIAIGASAGGIEALRTLVATLPSGLPASLLIAQHLSPTSPGMLPEILDRAGPLAAVSAQDEETLEPAKIYVAPPDRHLLVGEDGRLRLSRGPKENLARPAIDPLFRSAALVFGPRLIGVVLTGYLDDGTAGLQAIKLCGGAAIVQDPKEALAPGMPSSALKNVHVDYCLPLVEIGPQLVRMIAEPARPQVDKPRDLAAELAIFAGGAGSIETLKQIGEPTALTCPECHGALTLLQGERPARFRCHTGHAFTEQALLAGLAENTETAFWSAMRCLQEEAILKRHMAAHSIIGGADAEALLKDADEAMAAADRVRIIQENYAKRRPRRDG
ncbi:protein-glutamate methylesterase (plasmid) [Methylocystis iwaonis]|uniref:protein-glutamate methylesterase n=2 Tax=Methylocystis iwaonis TaxID=2885079 RepID=A0ABN6VJZ7_9HYPH|nr:chemotaxis protein CheB [Methylocystis iwaonis]BDV36051.1 protein-glutamate methylesterase [Methylocystis iwaonis]